MTATAAKVYTEVRLEVPRVHADAVCNYIIDHISGGLVLEEEEDSPVTGIRFYVPGQSPEAYRPGLDEYLRQVLPTGVTPAITETVINDVEWVEE